MACRRRPAVVSFAMGLVVLGGVIMTQALARATITPLPRPLPVATPIALPAPGQALLHEFTTSTGATCTVILTATSSDPRPVCGAETPSTAGPVLPFSQAPN